MAFNASNLSASNEGGEKIALSSEDFEEKQVELGAGASGKVFKMKHKPTKQDMAVKVIYQLDKNEKEKDLLMTELNTLMSCDCPYIIKCFGAFYKKSQVFVAMEFMDLGTLADLILPNKVFMEGALGLIAYQVLTGLDYLHRTVKILHRDIKPSNILVNSQGVVIPIYERANWVISV